MASRRHLLFDLIYAAGYRLELCVLTYQNQCLIEPLQVNAFGQLLDAVGRVDFVSTSVYALHDYKRDTGNLDDIKDDFGVPPVWGIRRSGNQSEFIVGYGTIFYSSPTEALDALLEDVALYFGLCKRPYESRQVENC